MMELLVSIDRNVMNLHNELQIPQGVTTSKSHKSPGLLFGGFSLNTILLVW